MAASENLTGSSGSIHHKIPHHHHHIRRHRVPSGGEELEEEELDPRIQIELEKLNRASEEINRLELELDDARAAFRQVLSDSTQRLNGLAKKVGTCVDKARPYYDARMRLKEAHLESQKAALRFERACSMHEAAKEMVQLAEEGYKRRELDLDPTWQEMLNHATMKVNDAERERIESEDFHQKTTLNFKRREEEVQKLQKDLKRAITKSRPYFEMKAKFNQVMEDHKRAVSRLEEDVSSTKALYSQALRSLEAISDDIHRQRLERRQKLQLGVRGAGVGAEAPSPPPPSWEKGVNIEGSASCQMFDSDADDDAMNANRGQLSSSETALEVNQLKMNRSRGIVCYEPAYRKKASLTESFIQDGNFKSDPLDVVVFKTSGLHPRSKYLQECHSPSASAREMRDVQGWPIRNIPEGPEREFGDNVVTPTPENVLELSAAVTPIQSDELVLRGRELNLSGSPGLDSPLSESPRKRDIELSQSSLSRAQEWVNKSPIPQQRRFVKSKSLIDASSQSLSISSPPDSEISSSLSSDIMKSIIKIEGGENMPSLASSVKSPQLNLANPGEAVDEAALVKQSDLASRTISDQPLLNSSVPYFTSSQHSFGSVEGDQVAPSPGSPSMSRKSPKLQGLILRVDATGISSSSAQSPPSQSRSMLASGGHPGQTPKVVISTQHPILGVFTEKPPQPQSSMSVQPPSSLPPSVKPPTSLIAQHLNKMINVTKASHYNSKTAPSTLSTSYHLSTSSPLKSPHGHPPNSPTKIPLSPIPHSTTVSLRHQLTSPTPSSPSADRYSLSGRSDSVTSGSHKSAFLKPPSDSSDTESIASTGPMLDDDQVELINMDFTEQSITADAQDDSDYNLIHTDPSVLNRGHWSRMSLPPRLSYLEGFLERARLYLGDRKIHNLEDTEEKSSVDIGSKNGSGSARSSVAASGDLDDNAGDFKDEDYDNNVGNRNENIADTACSPAIINKEPHLDDENTTVCNNVDVEVNVEIHVEDVSGAGHDDTLTNTAEGESVDVEVLEAVGTPYMDDISLQIDTAGEVSTEVTVFVTSENSVEIIAEN